MPTIALTALAVAIGLAFWKLFCEYFTKSPLDNIPGPERTSFWRGNQGDLFNRHAWGFHDRLREKYGPVTKFHGPLGTRGLYVFDPKALNNITVKDQLIYDEPRWFIASNLSLFGTGLLSTLGEHHRKQRKLLNPVFSINHMRHMTPIFYHTVRRLQTAVSSEVGGKITEVNMMDWMGRTALELVGQGGLGYSFDPLTSNVHNEYGEALKALIPTMMQLHFFRVLTPYFRPYAPAFLVKAIARVLPPGGFKNAYEIVKSMDEQSTNIFRSKKAALEKGDGAVVSQMSEGKDIMSILLKANLEAADEDKLPESELIGQMSTLTFAGTDTTSNAIARTLHILAERQDIQGKLRSELLEAAPAEEDIPYDTLVSLPYLDAICREVLRLHPPVHALVKETRQDVVMPLSEPVQGVNGEMITEIPVPKDTAIIIGIRACNRNKALWGEDAEEFKPERWLKGLPEAVTQAHVPGVYANLMTFFGGGRSCIGFKFSQLEMKVVLAVMLRSFKFHLGDKEIYWNVAGVNYPTVGKNATKSDMFLKLERL
ncbi:hypothetical protein PHLGIDRAFT_20511 [Phlebiopsis gigantea 11061_1 CR5-6]|uniref:Cytochrome P450 n=1 Tax=Phlebiopsis gigantea (strain 11061_1 CR5-6) TaxID=745531 RepID=A0A0C3RQP6_PHLG1|nr:hypothetical protein PHLGIDRAFT_20511 [Phlebiopsis gigantea 11061_1 CR5-6]